MIEQDDSGTARTRSRWRSGLPASVMAATVAAVATTLALAAPTLVIASPAAAAAAAARDGVCDSGEFCYYYNSDEAGSVSDFTTSVDDYGTSQPSCYDFKGPGNGQGTCVKNNAASAWNRSSKTARVYYNSGYAGTYQDFAAGAKGNLNATLKNNNASHLLITAGAEYYNTYADVATLGNANSCYSAQGFAVGSTYTYSAKINDAGTAAVIYRTKMSDGTTTLMSNGDTGQTYANYLGHANDIVLSSTGDNYYMFVVTMNADSTSLVKLRYVGTTYYKVGNYTIKHNGANKAMSGVKITSKDASNINFLFKSGRTFYRGSLPLNATSGTINVTNSFYLNIEDALVNGSPVANITSYTTQGIGYYGNTLYYPLTNKNVSIVLVYRNISSASGTIRADDNLSFRITSSAYPDLFEIEGVGVAGGDKLWFSTNRRTAPGDTAHDGVHYFNGYSAS
ncbi:peptidase inhibitor family I36 protein [Plantactinospora sp. B5E13]|uniref:peptidase inhibitor family I36 protein n=1 Tax=Plantactinospora sp. B5E13 TaxID=3153758 RepID=UPI00325EBD98